jgi:hypothetical protein
MFASAAAGACLIGLCYALFHPALGVRGSAWGLTPFLDVALWFGSFVVGLVAGWAGLRSVILTGATVVLATALIAAHGSHPIGHRF